MIRRCVFTLTALAALYFVLALPVGTAIAQTARELVGTWTWVSLNTIRPDGTRVQQMGANPKGVLIFDSNGRYFYLISRSGRPKFSSNNINEGTPEENKATTQGSLAYSGTYSVSDKTIIFRVEASTFPNAEGAEQRRVFALTGDELKYTNPASVAGGTAEAVLRRVK